MGVGAEVNAGQPVQVYIPGQGLRWEYSWGWRQYLGAGADQWHASTGSSPLTHLTATEHADVAAAARSQTPGLAIAAALATSSGAAAWADAKAEAQSRGQYGALLAKCVQVYG